MATDRTIWKQAERARLASISNFSTATAVNTVGAAVHQRRLTVVLPADAASATDITYPLIVADRAINVVSARLTFSTGVASATAIYTTLTLQSDSDTGASTATIATISNSAAAAYTANVSTALTLTSTNTPVASGSALRLARTHASTGTLLPVMTLDLVYEEV